MEMYTVKKPGLQFHTVREQSGLRSCYSLIGFIQWPCC